jgi:hypothetical protein
MVLNSYSGAESSHAVSGSRSFHWFGQSFRVLGEHRAQTFIQQLHWPPMQLYMICLLQLRYFERLPMIMSCGNDRPNLRKPVVTQPRVYDKYLQFTISTSLEFLKVVCHQERYPRNTSSYSRGPSWKLKATQTINYSRFAGSKKPNASQTNLLTSTAR